MKALASMKELEQLRIDTEEKERRLRDEKEDFERRHRELLINKRDSDQEQLKLLQNELMKTKKLISNVESNLSEANFSRATDSLQLHKEKDIHEEQLKKHEDAIEALKKQLAQDYTLIARASAQESLFAVTSRRLTNLENYRKQSLEKEQRIVGHIRAIDDAFVDVTEELDSKADKVTLEEMAGTYKCLQETVKGLVYTVHDLQISAAAAKGVSQF